MRGHARDMVRDREAPGSNPGPPTKLNLPPLNVPSLNEPDGRGAGSGAGRLRVVLDAGVHEHGAVPEAAIAVVGLQNR